MTALALPFVPDLFSIVTMPQQGRERPAWAELFGWPSHGDTHIAADEARTLWAARLDEAVTRADRSVLLMAEGPSCFAAAWWARLSPAPYVEKVAGALMFLPGDSAELTGRQRDWESPRLKLPFPSIVVTDGDPASAQIRALGRDWGSESIAGRGRLLEAATPWRHALRAVDRFTARVVARDIVVSRHQRR